jgi:hypothetical protein
MPEVMRVCALQCRDMMPVIASLADIWSMHIGIDGKFPAV